MLVSPVPCYLNPSNLEARISISSSYVNILPKFKKEMAHLSINPDLLSTLKDKVVVLTGGATGIGRSTVRLFHRAFSPPLHPSLSSQPHVSSIYRTTSPIAQPTKKKKKNCRF